MRVLTRSFSLVIMLLLPVTGCSGNADTAGGAESAREGHAQSDSIPEPDAATARLFERVMQDARDRELHSQPLGDVMQAVGLQFLEKPYLTGVLDVPGEETLICRLDGFDCVTFLESALALARGIRAEDYSYEAYARRMRDQRYRAGEMEGYCSRLHYFTEWISDNDKRGNVRDITQDVGGIPYEKSIDFMSQNRESYPRFAANDSLFGCIRAMEAGLAETSLHYIPQDKIREAYPLLEAGDIVATATDIEGLDVTHTGLVYDHGEGRIGLLHASTSGGVKVSPDLQAYVQENRRQIGIVVARPTAP